MTNIDITESAQKYLAELLGKQDTEGIGIRIFVSDPGTPKAETCIAYCRPGEEKEDDEEEQRRKSSSDDDTSSPPFDQTDASSS